MIAIVPLSVIALLTIAFLDHVAHPRHRVV